MQLLYIFSIKTFHTLYKYGNFDNHAVSRMDPRLKTLCFFHSFAQKTGLQILNLPANSVFQFRTWLESGEEEAVHYKRNIDVFDRFSVMEGSSFEYVLWRVLCKRHTFDLLGVYRPTIHTRAQILLAILVSYLYQLQPSVKICWCQEIAAFMSMIWRIQQTICFRTY